jgi:hypothetical protein
MSNVTAEPSSGAQSFETVAGPVGPGRAPLVSVELVSELSGLVVGQAARSSSNMGTSFFRIAGAVVRAKL